MRAAGIICMAFPLTLLSNTYSDAIDELRFKKKAKVRSASFQKEG
eukprot:gene17328-3172_t